MPEREIPQDIQQQYEPEKLEQIPQRAELSPEIVEKILDKVQDIDAPGVAYSVIGINKYSAEHDIDVTSDKFWYIRLKSLISILTEGLNPGRGRGNDHGQGVVFFNITGRVNIITHGEKIDRSRIEIPQCPFFNYPGSDPKNRKDSRYTSIAMLFNVSEMEERTEEYEKTKTPHPSLLKNGYVQDYPHTLARGFFTGDSVTPDKYTGIVLSQADTVVEEGFKEALKEYTGEFMNEGIDLQNCETVQDYITSLVMQLSSQHPDLMIPIYDDAGNLIWPKKINYEEVKTLATNQIETKSE